MPPAPLEDLNRVFFLLFPPEQQEQVAGLLGEDWERDANRQRALDAARAAIEQDPQDSFAWFNLGSNLVYFARYAEAAEAYDTVRQLGMPQRMLRYQLAFPGLFPRRAHGRLLAMSAYALKSTPNSEEALLWQGWGLYRQGDRAGALASFRAALDVNPLYGDAHYAINYVNNN